MAAQRVEERGGNVVDVVGEVVRLEVQTGTPEQFGDLVKSEVGRWAKVIKDAGIRAD